MCKYANEILTKLKELDNLIKNLEPKDKPINLEENSSILQEYIIQKDSVKTEIDKKVSEISQIITTLGKINSFYMFENDAKTIQTEMKNKINNFERKWTEKAKYLEDQAEFTNLKLKFKNLSHEISDYMLAFKQHESMDGLLERVNKIREFEEQLRKFGKEALILKNKTKHRKEEVELILEDINSCKEKLEESIQQAQQQIECNKKYWDSLNDWSKLSKSISKRILELSTVIANLSLHVASPNFFEENILNTDKLKTEIKNYRISIKSKIRDQEMFVKSAALKTFGFASSEGIKELEEDMAEHLKTLDSFIEKLDSLKSDLKFKQKEKELEMQLKEESERMAKKAREEAARELEEKKKIEVSQNTQTDEEPPPRPPAPDLEPRPVAPIFTKGLKDLVIMEGNGCSLNAEVSGVPIPKITWFKDGIPVDDNTDYISKFENGVCSLAIEESMKEDSANWSVRASNKAGYSESHAKLTVKEVKPIEDHYPPSFIEKLLDSQVKEGQSLELRCKVDGKPFPSVSWYKNGVCIDKSKYYNIGGENEDCVLRIEHAYLEDASEFTCKIVNSLGQALCSARLSVIPKEPAIAPQFDKPLTNVIAGVGQEICLECVFSGMPFPVITWFKDNKAITSSSEIELKSSGYLSQLRIREAYPKSAGTYICKVQNIAGEALTTSTIYFKAKTPEFTDSETSEDMKGQKPAFYVPLSNMQSTEKENVSLQCSIVSFPKPEVTWYKDNFPIDASNTVNTNFDGETCILTLKDVNVNQSGTYMVKAKNNLGECKSSCILNVKPMKTSSDSQTQTSGETEITRRSNSYTHSITNTSTTKKVVLVDSNVEKKSVEPKFVSPIEGKIVEEGDSVTLEGTITGRPMPKITWLRNGKVLVLDMNTKISHLKNKSILSIDKVYLLTNPFHLTELSIF